MKIKSNQSGIMIVPIIVGVFLLGSISTFAVMRIQQNQAKERQQASEKKLQDSLEASKKLLEEKKKSESETVKLPASEQPVQTTTTTKPATTSAPPKTTTPSKTTTKPTENKQPSTPPSGSISLQYNGGKNVSWAVSGGKALYGFKLVWSASPGPTYPNNNPTYYSSATTSSANVEAPSGNHYVRVCMYHEGTCINYSNEVLVTIP